MAKELQQTLPEARRKRVQRLKKMIIGIVAAGIVIPLLCCVYLICRLHTIDGTLKTLEQPISKGGRYICVYASGIYQLLEAPDSFRIFADYAFAMF